jgi:protein TonB
MPIYVALLLSLILHVAVFVAPAWLAGQALAPKVPTIEARLVPLPEARTMADAVSTETSTAEPDTVAPHPATRPQRLQGGALRRAQTALSRHLFYPPEAIARGLEGEVILLLTLTESGQLAKAEIARSSGHALLDQAALAAAQQLGALPGNTRQTLFPVNFRLN